MARIERGAEHFICRREKSFKHALWHFVTGLEPIEDGLHPCEAGLKHFKAALEHFGLAPIKRTRVERG